MHFVDHASGYVYVEFELDFSAIETIRAKQNFEEFAFNNGVIPILLTLQTVAHLRQINLSNIYVIAIKKINIVGLMLTTKMVLQNGLSGLFLTWLAECSFMHQLIGSPVL